MLSIKLCYYIKRKPRVGKRKINILIQLKNYFENYMSTTNSLKLN